MPLPLIEIAGVYEFSLGSISIFAAPLILISGPSRVSFQKAEL